MWWKDHCGYGIRILVAIAVISLIHQLINVAIVGNLIVNWGGMLLAWSGIVLKCC